MPTAEVIELDYTPRPLQADLHALADSHRFGVAVCHRRFGKTVFAVNHLIRACATSTKQRPRFAYIAPTYRQGKSICWDYLKHYTAPIPGVSVNESELRVDLPHGGQVRIYGADNPDALRGIYLDGVVLDEFGLMAGTVFSEVIRPLLADRSGWAIFIGTPNGKNQFYRIAQQARHDPEWFFAEFKVSETGYLDAKELTNARTVMTADEYLQEFECSFEASVKGAVFARELQQVREDGRITQVPYDPELPVDTNWDIGTRDATAIWFTQDMAGGGVRVIDYHEDTGHGLGHYAKLLHQRPYTYGVHWFPHDINQTEFTTGKTRIEEAQRLLKTVQVAPKLQVDEGLNAVRLLLPKCYFDRAKTEAGVEALTNYRWDWNERIKELKPVPVHDWASHGADAFRTLAVRYLGPRHKKPQGGDPHRDVDPMDQWYRREKRYGGRRPGGF